MGDIKKQVEIAEGQATRQAFCSNCDRDTKHATLYARTVRCEEILDDEEIGSIDWADTYSLIECCGCESVRFLHEHWFSEDWDDQGPVQHKRYYPPNEVRQQPVWITGLPLDVFEMREMLDEIYKCLGVGAYRLATMGIRALVERVMIDRVKDQHTFEKNIATFFAEGYVAERQQKMFKDILVEAGHAAMHRGWEPRAADVMALLDVVEGLLKSIYVDPIVTAKIAERIPLRARGRKP